MEIKCAIATAETDAEISYRERVKGATARIDGLPITACPWRGGMCEYWWKQGYQGQHNIMVAEPASTVEERFLYSLGMILGREITFDNIGEIPEEEILALTPEQKSDYDALMHVFVGTPELMFSERFN